MTLQQALASGKPFKRASQSLWRQPKTGTGYLLTEDDVLAEDYQIRNEKVEVHFIQIHDAWQKAHIEKLSDENRLDIFLSNIGLG